MSDEIAFEADGVLAKFFEKSLASEPKARFASASEMKRSLTNAIAGLQN